MIHIIFVLLLLPFSALAQPVVNFTIANQSVSELQRDVGIMIQLDAPTDKVVRVAFDVGGTASFPDDHDLRPGEFIISPGETTGFVTFRLVDDETNEGSESVILNLTFAQNAQVGTNSQHEVAIQDLSLAGPTLSFDVADSNAVEGTGVTVTASIDQMTSNTVIAQYRVSGTATSGDDYILSAGFLEITPGTTSSSLYIPILSDGVTEGSETLVIRIISPIANAQMGAIDRHIVNISDAATSHPLEGTWYGYAYDIENSIREDAVNSDDNAHLAAWIIDSNGMATDNLSQNGTLYAFQDISSFNVNFVQTAGDANVYTALIPGEARKNLYIHYGGYFAEIEVWADSDITNGTIEAGEVRSRISIYQNQVAAPYPLARSTSSYNFGLIAGQTYSGVTIDPDTTTSTDGYFISNSTTNNTLTFGANLTTPFTGSLETSSSVVSINDAKDAFVPLGDGADADILGNHATFVGPIDGTHTRAFAMVASPDGNAIVVATCHNLAVCGGNMNPNDEESIFDVEQSATAISAMTFSLLIQQ